MDGYGKTTGKIYEEGELVKCSCGNIYNPEQGSCQECGTSATKASKFQRTLATAKEEKEVTYE